MKRAALYLTLFACFFSSIAVCQQEAIRVSLEDILKAPNQYHNKLIETHGFLLQEFENSGLYSTSSWRGTKGIWITPVNGLHIEREKTNRRYVVVTGVFDANQNGHLGQFAGTLLVRKLVVSPEDKPEDRPKNQ